MIELLWNGPVSEAKMTQYIDALQLAAQDNVIDFGCGCGEILLRVHEKFGIRGLGIDNSKMHIEEAKRRSIGRVHEGRIRFEEANVCDCSIANETIDLAICAGSTHTFGLGANAYGNAIDCILPMLSGNGMMLIGEGYMKQPASPEYRKLLGDDMPDHMTHLSNVRVAQARGLTVLAAWTSSLDEWDAFEWNYQRIVEVKAAAGDEDSISRLAKRREWMDGYLEYGRDTLGYGMYLFRK